jgi:hypothetical protein
VHREREAQHGHGAQLGGGPARNASTGRAPADRDRQAVELATTQLLDHRRPRGVEVPRRRGGFAPGDHVWLLDQGDGDARAVGSLGGRL